MNKHEWGGFIEAKLFCEFLQKGIESLPQTQIF